MILNKEVEVELTTEEIWDNLNEEERGTIFEWFLNDYHDEALELLEHYNKHNK